MVQKEDAKGKTSKGRKRKRPIAGTTIKLANNIEKTPENSLSEEESKIKDEGKETTGVESIKTKKNPEKGGKSMEDDVKRELENINKSIEEQRKFNERIGSVVENFFAKEKEKQENARIQSQVEPIIAPLKEEVGKIGETLQSLQKKLEPFGDYCTSIEECKTKIAKYEEKAKEIPPKEPPKLDGQELWETLKSNESWLQDIDNIYAEKFAKDPEYRKLAMEKLPKEAFVEMAKNKEIEDKLTGMCEDEICRIDVKSKIKEAEKKPEKKLL